RGWRFLVPYVRDAEAYVFTRPQYLPRELDARRGVFIPPSLDPFSAKNQPLSAAAVSAILVPTGIIAGHAQPRACLLLPEDGTPAGVDGRADIVRVGAPPSGDTPLVTQVSRWDRLKDPVGVLEGFARLRSEAACDAHLVLAGPTTRSVADDPEGAEV